MGRRVAILIFTLVYSLNAETFSQRGPMPWPFGKKASEKKSTEKKEPQPAPAPESKKSPSPKEKKQEQPLTKKTEPRTFKFTELPNVNYYERKFELEGLKPVRDVVGTNRDDSDAIINSNPQSDRGFLMKWLKPGQKIISLPRNTVVQSVDASGNQTRFTLKKGEPVVCDSSNGDVLAIIRCANKVTDGRIGLSVLRPPVSRRASPPPRPPARTRPTPPVRRYEPRKQRPVKPEPVPAKPERARDAQPGEQINIYGDIYNTTIYEAERKIIYEAPKEKPREIKKKKWPWIVGGLAVGGGIAAGILLPRKSDQIKPVKNYPNEGVISPASQPRGISFNLRF